MSKPLVIALGHKARSGKGVFATTIRNEFPNVEVMAFADLLREEVRVAAKEVFYQIFPENADFCGITALHLLCDSKGIIFDPKAPVEANYPWGKQRALLQWWGTEYRRAEDPDYWLKKVEERILNSTAAAIIIDDLRFPNEFEFIGRMGGYRIKLTRLNFDNGISGHLSETALDGYTFDFELGIPDGRLDVLQSLARTLYVSLKWDSLQ